MSAPSPSTPSDTQLSPVSPPAKVVKSATTRGRTRKEGNDSLWKRAKRTLGTSSLTFLQPQSRPSPGKTNDASASGTGPAAPSKRREQVRHAQKVHRQRTQNYIKTLESEVVRLRGSETNLMQEKDRLRGQVNMLRTTLMFSNIPLPPGIDQPTMPEDQIIGFNDSEMATVSYRTDELSHERLHLNWTPTSTEEILQKPYNIAQGPTSKVFSHRYCEPPDKEALQNFPDEFSLQPIDFGTPEHENPSTKTASKHLDTPDIAIEFVLALEHPCMTHIQHPAGSSSTNPSGHVHMASAPLISSAPRQPELNTSWNWTANGSVIKELLNLSSSINLDGEITPVEAWHRIRKHFDFWKLDRRGLDSLKNELSLVVTCYGFGAVLDEQTYQHAVHKYLGTGHSLYAIS